MRTIPLLKDMNIADLTQRYASSYVMYNNNVYLCEGFTLDGNNILYIKLNNYVPFDWRLLNTYRPPARWYWCEKYGYFYLRYLPQRQYQRGFSSRNCAIYSPFRRLNIDPVLLQAIFQQERTRHSKKTIEQVWESVKLTRGCILTDHFFISEINVYYRKNVIGEVQNKQLFLTDNTFAQEMKELGLPCQFSRPATKDTPKKEIDDYEIHVGEAPQIDWNVARAALRPRPA